MPLRKVIIQLWTSGAEPLSMEESEQTTVKLCKGICRRISEILPLVQNLPAQNDIIVPWSFQRHNKPEESVVEAKHFFLKKPCR